MTSVLKSRSLVLAGCVAALAVGTVTARALPLNVSATLTGGAETPPNSSGGKGMLTGTFDPATHTFTYSIDYSGLTGPAIAAHFHAAAPAGKPAGVEIPIKGALASPIKGESKLTTQEEQNLTGGMTYVNIHTAANKNGEIRGQLAVSK